MKEQPFEVVTAEPCVEDVEDREEPIAGISRTPLDLGLKPLVRPELLAALEKREHEVVLRREVTVKRHSRHA